MARRNSTWAMVLLLPLAALAAQSESAVVHGSQGGVWINGLEVADSITVFPGDSLETKPGFVANLDAEGSAVLIQPESIVKFQGDYLVLEHGSVNVGTSTAMRVHVNCIRVEPISKDRTQYDVTDLSGKVEVAAGKNDVEIRQGGSRRKASSDSSSNSSVVHEGHTETRYESTVCGAAPAPQGAGHAINPKLLEIGGAGTGAAVLCLLLCKSPSPSSVSPSSP